MAPWQLVFIVELLLLSVIVSPSSATQNYTSHNNGIPCTTDLPPPFAYNGSAIDGFTVKCQNNTSVLQLRNGTYNLKSINVSGGYVTISSSPISILCPNKSMQGSAEFHVRGTPYTLSTKNKLIVLGCNSLVVMQGLTAIGVYFVTTGCASFCDELVPYFADSCSGMGCCQADIPRNLKNVFLSTTILNVTIGKDVSWHKLCTLAFFVNQDSLDNDPYYNNYYYYYYYSFHEPNYSNWNYHDVILEWAIGNKNCTQAKKNSTSYACKNNSYCYNSPDRVGYRCNCKAGYKGNPYAKGGCIDIDECADKKLNPCVGICNNIPGNVYCTCPPGQRGDGTKQGNGCKRVDNRLEIALSSLLIPSVSLGTLFLLIFGSSWTYCFLKKRELMKLRTKFFRQNGGLLLQQQISSQGNTTMIIFSEEALRRATANFNESHVLGQGGYGTVYKGLLPDHRIVAIKKSRLMDETQIEQFVNEVVILSQINHRNVVKLLGCCLETQVPLLVYEYILNGSLFEHLHSKGHIFSLSWEARLRIAAETAGALAYLHSAASIPIIHRDVKSANILLDESYTAKISDFGASRNVPFDQTHVTTLIQGTLGYLDPEYFRTSQLTEKSDVYSFGVVLAELITGEMPISFARSEILRNLASYFIVLLDENRLLELIEAEILSEAGIEETFNVAQLVRKCLSTKGEERPTMKEVAMELEGLRKLKRQCIDQQKEEELECLLGGAVASNSNTEDTETSRQFSLENHMILSADYPR